MTQIGRKTRPCDAVFVYLFFLPCYFSAQFALTCHVPVTLETWRCNTFWRKRIFSSNLPDTCAHRHLWLASVSVIDRAGRVSPSHSEIMIVFTPSSGFSLAVTNALFFLLFDCLHHGCWFQINCGTVVCHPTTKSCTTETWRRRRRCRP